MDGSTTASPSKRRALAPLDANAVSSPKPAAAFGLVKQHQQHQQPQVYVGVSPLRKRAVEASAAAASPRPLKKTCVEVRVYLFHLDSIHKCANTASPLTEPIHTLTKPHTRGRPGGG